MEKAIRQSDRQAAKWAERQLRQANREHKTLTILALSLGVAGALSVVAGVAVWALSRSRRNAPYGDDPDAPLFV